MNEQTDQKRTVPAVSVVVPAFRVTSYITEALDSIFAQTFSDYEVIVVNDGCPDTGALERVLAPYQDRIVYIKQQNLGLSGARNTAIRSARAPLIALLDADDIWETTYLAVQVAAMEADPSIDMVYCDGVFFGRRAQAGKRFMELCPSKGEVTFKSLITQRCNVMVSSVIRRDTLVRVGPFDEELRSAEDFDLWLRIAKRGGKIAYHRQSLVRVRKRKGSLSSNPIWMWGQGLQVLRKFERDPSLTPEEAITLEREIRRFQANRDFYEGKKAFFDGDATAAIQQLERANMYLKRAKISALLFFLKLHPGLAIRVGREWHHLLGRS